MADLKKLDYQELSESQQQNHETEISNIKTDLNNNNYILLANTYFQQNDYKTSKKYAERAVSNNPLQAEGYNILGQIYKIESELDIALCLFKQAILINPRYTDAYINLANLFIDTGELQQAVETYLTVLQFNPQHYYIRNYLGTLLNELGNHEEAKTCFHKAVESKPDYAAAWNNLGCIYYSEKEYWLAIHHFEKATIMNPTFFEAFLNLGNVLKESRIMEKARIAYEKALQLSPQNAHLLANLAFVYNEEGLKEISINFYKRAIELQPNYPDAYCNLANVLRETQRDSESEKYYRMALAYNPTHPDSLNNLANIKREQGNLEEALFLYMKALEISPNFDVAHCNISCIYKLQGHLDKALKHYQEALKINSSSSDTYNDMGNIYKEMLDFDGALQCYEKAIELNSMSAEAHCNLANLFKDRGLIVEAIDRYKYSLQLKTSFPDAYCSMVHCLLIICDWTDYTKHTQAINSLTQEQLRNNQFPSVHPHHSMLYPFENHRIHKLIAEKFAKFCIDKIEANKKNCFLFSRVLESKLKIGYVSSDFGNHPTSHLMQSVPKLHNRDFVETFCYSLSPNDYTNFRSNIANNCDHFIDLSEIPCIHTAAKIIHNDGIHILINMNGYTRGARNEIFALRPAPIQVMWLGFPGTSGASFIDYLITDKITSPPGFAHYYSEKFAYMPNTLFIGDHKQMFPHLQERIIVVDKIQTTKYISETNIVINSTNFMELIKCDMVKDYENNEESNTGMELSKLTAELPLAPISEMIEFGRTSVTLNGLTIQNGLHIGIQNPKVATGEEIPRGIIVTSRQQYGLLNDVIVYCNFNQLYKIDPDIFETWVMILKQVPNSILWLLRFPLAGEDNIRKTAANLGLDQNRIVFTDVAQKEEHVRRGQLADICLDTVMCNGHTTNMDVLWTGTPVVTLSATVMASRIAASQLYGLRCPELITRTKEEYLALAVRLGTDRQYLTKIRAKVKISRKLCPLFDCSLYVKHLEMLYSQMWSRYENKLEPDHIDLNTYL